MLIASARLKRNGALEENLLLFGGYKHAGRLKETKQEPMCRGLRIEDTQERYHITDTREVKRHVRSRRGEGEKGWDSSSTRISSLMGKTGPPSGPGQARF